MSPDYRAMRDLLRQRMVMEHKRTNIIQRVSSILAQFNITKLSVSPYQTGFADFLSECSLPEEYRMTLLCITSSAFKLPSTAESWRSISKPVCDLLPLYNC